jgi:hypothetical protein
MSRYARACVPVFIRRILDVTYNVGFESKGKVRVARLETKQF